MYETGVIIIGALVIAHGGGFEVHGQWHYYQKRVSSALYQTYMPHVFVWQASETWASDGIKGLFWGWWMTSERSAPVSRIGMNSVMQGKSVKSVHANITLDVEYFQYH